MMRTGKFEHIVFLILATVVSCSYAEKTAKILRANCIVHDPTTIQNVSCWGRPFNRTVSVINMRCNITKILRQVKINMQLYRRKDLVFKSFIVNVTDDYCQFFDKNKGGFFLKILTQIYLPYTNLNHTCPYFGHAYIKDLPLHSGNIPKLWAAGEYRLDILVVGGEGRLVTMQYFFEIKDRERRW